MNYLSYSLEIPEGIERNDGYVELAHKSRYTIKLSNQSTKRCDVEVHIDGGRVGVWRVSEQSSIILERPVHDRGFFTFFESGSPEAVKSGISINDYTGLITAIFKPERQCDQVLYAGSATAIGGTGLSGYSSQEFSKTEQLDYDDAEFVTIYIRLIPMQNEPRPLFPKSTQVPPLLR